MSTIIYVQICSINTKAEGSFWAVSWSVAYINLGHLFEFFDLVSRSLHVGGGDSGGVGEEIVFDYTW